MSYIKKTVLILRRQDEEESSLEGIQDSIEKIIEDATSLDGDGFENLDMVKLLSSKHLKETQPVNLLIQKS